ncbi:MAG: lipopolysaccharide biosynthesis protein [Brucellaceae bacterium]|nr:lipopolysaccharide biosynthesis protein [Brucellaceae bacterium]
MRFSAITAADRVLPSQMAARARPLFGYVDHVLFDTGEMAEARRRSLIAFMIRIFNAAIAFMSQVIMARWMGEFHYGIFVLVWVWMLILGSLAPMGFHTSIIRFLPQYASSGQDEELRGILVTTRIFALLAATVAAIVGIAGIWLFADHVPDYYMLPFVLGFICVPMIAFSDSLDGVARAKAWIILALAPAYAVRPVLLLAFMAGALLLGFPPEAKTALIAAIAATYVTTIGQFAIVMTRMGGEVKDGPRRILFMEWASVSLPIFLVEGFFFLLMNTDVLLVGYFMSPHDVAIYFATVKTLAIAHFVYFAVKAGSAQQYARYLSAGDDKALARFVAASVNWTFWPTLAMALMMLALGKPMLMLFGESFTAGYELVFILVFGVIARASVGPAESLLNMSGNQNICAGVYAITLAVNIGLNILLIPQMGLAGAAVSTVIAMICEATMLALVVWWRLGIAMSVFTSLFSRAAR